MVMWQEDASISLTRTFLRCLPICHHCQLQNLTGVSEVATTSTIAWWAQSEYNMTTPKRMSITRVATLLLQLSLSMCVCDEDRCNANCKSCDSVCQEDDTTSTTSASSSEDTSTSTPEGSGQSGVAYASPLAVSAVILAMNLQWNRILVWYW